MESSESCLGFTTPVIQEENKPQGRFAQNMFFAVKNTGHRSVEQKKAQGLVLFKRLTSFNLSATLLERHVTYETVKQVCLAVGIYIEK